MRAVAAARPSHRFHISLRESRAENCCLKTGQRERRGAFALLARMARATGQDKRTALLRCCPFAFPCKSLKGAFDMENTNEHTIQNKYQVGNTLYQVTPVFREALGAEHIADKIERLILKDGKEKSAAV